MNDTLLAKHIKLASCIRKLQTYTKKISTRPLNHVSIPVWRFRSFTSALFLSNNANILSDNQLTLIIKLIDKFLISYNNGTARAKRRSHGYYDRWVSMRAELEERLEFLQEVIDDVMLVLDEDNKKFWLISIAGSDWCFDQQDETISIAIELLNGKTPIDWFVSKPEVHNRFGFVPHTLLSFWEITQKQFEEFNK